MSNRVFILLMVLTSVYTHGMQDIIPLDPERDMYRLVQEYCDEHDITACEWYAKPIIRSAFWTWLQSKSTLAALARTNVK